MTVRHNMQISTLSASRLSTPIVQIYVILMHTYLDLPLDDSTPASVF